MKKLILILTITILLSSCGNKDNSNNLNTTNTGLVSTGNKVLEEKTMTGEIVIEESTKNELIEITHKNFKPIVEKIEKMKKEELKKVDCEKYFYLPESEKRPEFQLNVAKEYIKKCEDMKK